MVEEELNLTPSQLAAKRYMMNMLKNAALKPCDIGDGANISATLPRWYNKASFKRGQKYFADNRFGMLTSNMCGLLSLLADPKGLDVLDSTGRSSTAETAKKRYVSTVMHMLSWYEVELYPDSKSWDSLNRVRKMHLNASNSTGKKEIGIITQAELAFTTFGFMGFALVRPQLLGIRSDNKEDREGFIHFWAVIGHMLGVHDEYNMCLFDIATVESICLIMLRYIFIPIIQLETPKFKAMTKALLKGLSPFLPHMSYEIQMFFVKRIIGVPGYQYDVDLSKEKICRSVFSVEELAAAKEVMSSMHKGKKDLLEYYEILFNDGIPITAPRNCVHLDMAVKIEATQNKDVQLDDNQSIAVGDKSFRYVLRSKDIGDWQDYLNDAEFFVLSKWDRLTVRWTAFMLKCYENSVGRYFCEMGLDGVLFFIRRYYKLQLKRCCQ